MLFHAVKHTPDKIQWDKLSRNTEATPILEYVLETTPEKIIWSILARNPNAIHLLETHLDKLDNNGWANLCSNSNAIHLLSEKQHLIDWNLLSENPAIFEDEPTGVK